MARSIDFSALPDEEGYIYLDQDSMPLPMLEISVIWMLSPEISTLVTVNKKYPLPSESIEYLQLKIAECMEKYSLFGGLTNLTAFNLTGEVGKVLKTGDVLIIELTSYDLWLNIELRCPAADIVIYYEAKVNRSATILQLRAVIFEYALTLLKTRDKDVSYVLHNFKLYKQGIGRKLTTPNVTQLSFADLPQSVRYELEDDKPVSFYFDYLSCSAVANLTLTNTRLTLCEIDPSRDPDLSSKDYNDDGQVARNSYPVRKLRFEEIHHPEETRKKRAARRSREELANGPKCVACSLF